jgi:hypothetical protein
MDSTLRNASHHGAIKINRHGEITYRSGGTGELRKMPYSQYLYNCNEMVYRLMALLIIELAFASKK